MSRTGEAALYTITVTRSVKGHEQAVHDSVKDYEIMEGVLTLAFDEDHDLVIPLSRVIAVDIVREQKTKSGPVGFRPQE